MPISRKRLKSARIKFLSCLVTFLVVSRFAVLLFHFVPHLSAAWLSSARATVTIGTSTSSSAIASSFQRKTFYARSQFWVFYSDGTNMVANYSNNGVTWYSCPQNPIRVCSSGEKFSVWYDGTTYFSYAYASSSNISYRKGSTFNGIITWAAAEQTVVTANGTANYPFVCIDASLYAWIGYRETDGASYYPYVIKSGLTDGTWGTTPSGFPYKLSTTSEANWRVSVVPLTTGASYSKVFVTYASYNTVVNARAWNGTAWRTAITTTNTIYYGWWHSATAQDDDVHLTFFASTGYYIIYVKYSNSTNTFGAETVLQTSATTGYPPVICRSASTNNLCVFWAGYPIANHVCYRKYTSSTDTWGVVTDFVPENATLTGNDCLTCFYQVYGGYIGLLYMTETATPYNVNFGFMTLNPTNDPLISNLIDMANKVNWTETIETAYLGTMFGKTTMTDLLNAIAASTSWQDVLTWSAITIKFGIENETKIKWALDKATMLAGLPYVAGADYSGFLCMDRSFLYGYHWADQYSYLQDKWNLTAAFNNFASAYNWTGHGFLCYYNASYTKSIEYGPRYFDECAQTLAAFLVFNEVCNVSEALTYAETEWKWLNNNLWCTDPTYGEPHFAYALAESWMGQGWECSGGAFLQIIGWLKHLSRALGTFRG